MSSIKEEVMSTRLRFLLAILLIASISGFLQAFLPWWILAVVAFIVSSILLEKGWLGFIAGFIGVIIPWFIYSMYLNNQNNGILSEKIANLMSLPNQSVLLLVVMLIVGMVGGMSALSGALLRNWIAD